MITMFVVKSLNCNNLYLKHAVLNAVCGTLLYRHSNNLVKINELMVYAACGFCTCTQYLTWLWEIQYLIAFLFVGSKFRE